MPYEPSPQGERQRKANSTMKWNKANEAKKKIKREKKKCCVNNKQEQEKKERKPHRKKAWLLFL